jgi:hypothetical protein
MTSYLDTLPSFQNPTSVYGRFIPASTGYLVGGDGTSVNTNLGKSLPSFSMLNRNAFVMTSDVSNTVCCYKLSKASSKSPNILRNSNFVFATVSPIF